jgi:hypothetical protein
MASKNGKFEDFAYHNRKTSPYLAQNELHSDFNRKVSAYFTSGPGSLSHLLMIGIFKV